MAEAETFDDESKNTLPPVINNNPRERIQPEQIPVSDISIWEEPELDVFNESYERILPPIPSHPLAVHWIPEVLNFVIGDKPVLKKLLVCNRCPRSIYVHCCGLWNDTARLGAGWRCYPRTRFLAPGLHAQIFVRATPRTHSPVPTTTVNLQLAAEHMRDTVVGYFSVTIQIQFLNYFQPVCEGG